LRRYDKIEAKMLEDRGPSIFPHAVSAWWIPILVAVSWGALCLVDIFHLDAPGEDGWTLAIGSGVTLPCTVAAVFSIPVQVFRLLMYFLNRPTPDSK
jgi:hypothetical protein